jgi:hypothetical protein
VGFRDMNIWKFGIFKGISSLISSPKHTLTCIHAGEDGVVSKNPLPLDTGYANLEPVRKCWKAIQQLMTHVQGVDEQVMVITDRSYIPDNPKRKLTTKEKAELVPLDDMADLKYNEAFTRVAEENQKNQNHQLLRTVLYLCFILTGIAVIVSRC